MFVRRQQRTVVDVLGVGIALLLGSAADAQIYDPPPTLPGHASFHLWSVPGVVNNGLATVFACTNTTSASVNVGVEVFAAAGGATLNDADATSRCDGDVWDYPVREFRRRQLSAPRPCI